MLSLNIPQVRFIAAVYAVTKRSITQACVVISSQSLQPTPKPGREGLGRPCLLSLKWSADSSPLPARRTAPQQGLPVRSLQAHGLGYPFCCLSAEEGFPVTRVYVSGVWLKVDG